MKLDRKTRRLIRQIKQGRILKAARPARRRVRIADLFSLGKTITAETIVSAASRTPASDSLPGSTSPTKAAG